MTTRKQRWVAQKRRTDIVRGSPIKPPAAVAARYDGQLGALIDNLHQDVRATVEDILNGKAAENYYAEDAGISDEYKKALNKLWKKYKKLFDEKAEEIAGSFAEQMDRSNASSVHASIKQLSGGLSLGKKILDADTKQVLKAVVAENVALIKSIPQQYLQRVEGAVFRSVTHPEGRNYLIREIQKTKQVTVKRAKMIANDQTRKANVALASNRLQKLGVKKFEWLHVPSSHPRELHEKLDGQIFSWDDPPVIQKDPMIKGYPAQLVNCRCEALPVIDFEE